MLQGQLPEESRPFGPEQSRPFGPENRPSGPQPNKKGKS